MKSLVLTLQFLTRLPLPWVIEGDDAIFARGVKYFPVAGAIIGLFNCLVFYLANLVFSPITAGFLTVLADTFMTGGLHLDGLSDTWDGVFSVRDRERMLEIMKDSRIGSFGVLGMLMALGCKWMMYTELAGGLSLYADGMDIWCRVLGPVVAAPIVGRIVMTLLIYISEYARKTGMGGLYFAHKDAMNLPATLIIGLALIGLCGYMAWLMVPFGIAAGLCFRAFIYRKLGGMTGDTLGASLEVTECIVLPVAVIAVRILGGLG